MANYKQIRATFIFMAGLLSSLFSIHARAFDVDAFSTFSYQRGKVDAGDKNIGYLAGSIGKVLGSKLSPTFGNAKFVISRKFESDPYLAVIYNHGGNPGDEIDIRTRDYESGTFLIPLKAGEYYISGLYQYDANGSEKNPVPFTMPVEVKAGQISYIGQYLAHKGPVFTVNNEMNRDKDFIEKRVKEKLGDFKLAIPHFTGVAGNYFPVVNNQYFEKLKELRDKDYIDPKVKEKKEIDELLGG